MKHMIAVNTKHTGDPSKDHRGYAEPMSSEQLDGLLSEDWLKKMVADIRAGNEKLKDDLPFACPHYMRFNNNHRAQADIIPETFTFMTCVDVDDREKVEQAIQRSLEVNSEEGGDWEGMVLRIDYSARKKVHIWVMMPVGKTIEETQELFCKEIGVPYDENCITPERFIYLTGKDEEIYRSERWLEALSEEELNERREAFLNRGLDVDGRGLKKNTDLTDRTDKKNPSNPSHPCSEEKCAEQAGLKVDAMDVWGVHNWHANLMAVLSVGVGKLMSRQQLQAVVAVRLPNYSQTEDCQKLINYFYEKYDTDKGFMNASLREINAKAQKNVENAQLSTFNSQLSTPQMPKKLPKLIGLLTSKTPEMYKPAVAHAVFPALATHLCEVRFEYTDHVEHEATLMNCLMAETGAGKGCIDQPIEHIMADIKRRDKENERREAEWKKDCQKKGANKDKMVRPEGLVIQMIDRSSS